MIKISNNVTISECEVDISFIRAQGGGGQNVNKVSTGVHLRFNISASSLPDFYKDQLTNLNDQRITMDGVVVIKAQRYRSQEKNRHDAFSRLIALIQSVAQVPKKRRSTKPTRLSQKKRIEGKKLRGKVKQLRSRVDEKQS